MRSLWVVGVWVAALPARFASGLFEAAATVDGVTEVMESTWATVVAPEAIAVVEFYAPWCQHCKRLQPEYTKAAAEVQGLVRFLTVDATEEEGLADKFDVDGFPSIKVLRYGEVFGEYSGPHEAAALARWARRKAEGAVAVCADWADVRAFFDQDADVFVAALVKSVTSDAAKAFKRMTADFEDDRVVFAVTTTRDHLGEQAKAAEDFDEFVAVLSTFASADAQAAEANVLPISPRAETVTAADLAAFVDAHSTPVVTKFDSATETSFFARDKGPPVHALLFVDVAHKATTQLLAAYQDLAATHRGALRFVYVPATEERVLDHFGILKSELPRLVVSDLRSARPAARAAHSAAAVLPDARAPENTLANTMPLPPAGETRTFRAPLMTLNRESMATFLESYLRGQAAPWLKSETAAYSLDKSGLVRLTGRTFDEVVTKSRRDADDETDHFVMFYAPWCGHCSALKPTWQSLADRFSVVDSVVIAEMDATLNEIAVDGVAVSGFPTIYFFPAVPSKPPLLYTDGRDLDSLVRFVYDHATKVATVQAEL